MKNRKKYSLILIAFLLALFIVCGTVLAYMFKQSEYKDNQFNPAEVSCEVHEVTDSNIPSRVTEKSSIKLKNTGNIDAYLRVRFVSYWVQTASDGSTKIASKPSVMPEFEIADGWIKGSNDTYYYQKPVAPGKLTYELLASESVIHLTEEDGYLQVVEVFAEAIQSKPEKAVTNRWNVELDVNGNIILAS